MAEYIEREAVNRISFTDAVLIDGEVRIEKIALVRDIEKLLAADVTPVRHGRWVPFHSEAAGDIQYCSVCEIGFDAKTVYCPNCGADMRGSNDE